jgi:diguanylate cyclase (GGDEF)-like protein
VSISTIDLPARGWLRWGGARGRHLGRVMHSGDEPGVLRLLAALALLVATMVLLCGALGYVLAGQADDLLEAERRQALNAAVEAAHARTSVSGDEPQLVRQLERTSGLKGLRLESEPVSGPRQVQSLLDRNGRIVGWLSWEPERPASAILLRLLPLLALIVAGLAGFAALAMWQLNRLGVRLARSEQQVQRLGYEDILTGLPNHSRFFGQLDRAIAARHGSEALAFAALDLDGFDEVNDALGYAGGDEVLSEIGRRLRDALPPSAIVARLGSDEFALVITGKNAEVATFVTDTVRQAIARPIGTDPAVQIGVSIGLAVAPQDGSTRDELTRRADLALRAAKRRGRGITVRFDGGMEIEFQERCFIKREAANALAERAFDVHYQPIVKADGGAIAGVEALLRWHHPGRGTIPPSVFVPVAEEAGLMDRLGELVLRRAVADVSRWRNLYVSVNLSPVQVRNRGFVEVVGAVLKESGLAPSRLVLEMTEGVLIDNPDEMSVRLSELRALGVQLALDDFGAGYSSLSYLQTLPFDKLKVDRGFVTALDRSANGGVFIQAIVALGRALGKGVLIEGVETEEQRVLLRLAGCNEMQGFLFAKPMPGEEIDRLLQEGGAAPRWREASCGRRAEV